MNKFYRIPLILLLGAVASVYEFKLLNIYNDTCKENQRICLTRVAEELDMARTYSAEVRDLKMQFKQEKDPNKCIILASRLEDSVNMFKQLSGLD